MEPAKPKLRVAPFYKATLGWDLQGLGTETPTGHPYWMIGRADGGHAGGAILLTPEMQMSGGTPAWVPYFHVDDVDAAVETASAHGAHLWLPPMAMDVGTMAMMGDPQGAAFYVMDPIPPEGQPEAESDVFEAKAPGHCWWNELETTDEPGATAQARSCPGSARRRRRSRHLSRSSAGSCSPRTRSSSC